MTEKIPKEKLSMPESDKYRPHNVLGTGGMKVIVRAEDIQTGRDVAMAISKVTEERNYQRFLDEARITASLEHPNIVPVHEIGITKNGSPFFTMKMINGYTLEYVLDKLREGDVEFRNHYTLRVLLDIFLKVCDAIAFAHSKNIIHLDLKPANIQVGDFGEVLVLDWGIARRLERTVTVSTETRGKIPMITSKHLTSDGVVKGTPEYMAPEQAEGKNQSRNKQTDIYALGAILYTLLTWNKPFHGKDTEEIIRNVLSGNIVPPHLAAYSDRKIPQALEFVIFKAMERNPEKRYHSVTSLKADLQSYMNGYATMAEEAGFFTNALLWLKRKKVQVYVFFSIFLLISITATFLGTHLYFQARSRDVYGTVVRARIDAEKTIAGLEAKIKKETASEWKLRFEDTFRDPYLYERLGFILGRDTELSLNQAKRFAVPRKNGGLRLFAGPARTNMVFRESLAGSEMRVMMQISWTAVRQGGILLAGLNNDNLNQGYLFAILPGKDACIALMRGETNEILAEHPIDLPAGEIGKFDMIVMPENGKMTMKMSFNGQELIVYRDGKSPSFITRNVFPCMLAFANTDLTLHSIKMMTLGTPMKADLLDIAERQMRKGNYEAARQLYGEAEESASNPERRRRAAQGLRQAAMLYKYKNKLSDWQKRLSKAWPGAAISLNMEQNGFALSASGESITDLSVLRGMPLFSLSLADSGLLDLLPLRDMKMNVLSLTRCKIADWTPLVNMNLQSFTLDSLPVHELPVLNMPDLRRLTITNCDLKSVAPLSRLRLTELNLSVNRISDISPLSKMPVQDLNLANNNLNAVAALSGMPLKSLNISNNRILSLDPLNGKNLISLQASYNQIRDISALNGMPLEELDLCFNSISSVSPLENSPFLHTLKLIHNQIGNIEMCSNLTNLTRLHIDYNQIDSVQPLRDCRNLRQLSFSWNRVENLAPLRNLKYLRSLNCSGNPVRDPEPIAGLNLNKLYAYQTKIASFRSFFRHSPKHFFFVADSTPISELEKIESELSGMQDTENLLRSVRILIAYKQKNILKLKSLATEMNGKYYVIIPILSDFRSARRDAFFFGAMLPSWKNILERNLLIRNIASPFWLGLRKRDQALHWASDDSLFFRYVSPAPDIAHGGMCGSGILLDGLVVNSHPEIRLPLVLEWERK